MIMTMDSILDAVASGGRLDEAQALALAAFEDAGALTEAARGVRDRRSGDVVTYSPKVFLPLTELCRDVCRYCTFAKTPGNVGAPYLAMDDAIDIARRGAAAGCTEVLFTWGTSPSAGTERRAKRWPEWASSRRSTIWSTPHGVSTRKPGSCPAARGGSSATRPCRWCDPGSAESSLVPGLAYLTGSRTK